MPEPPYRPLRIFLRVFSLLAVAGGLLLIFADKSLIVRIFLRPPEGEVSTLLLSILKEMGGIVLMLGALLWLASRNPVRNVAIVDGLIVGLCILAVTPLLSLWMTDIGRLYPAYFLWGRSAVRLAIAALLYLCLPKTPAGLQRSPPPPQVTMLHALVLLKPQLNFDTDVADSLAPRLR